jgi:hypothetical protein
MASMDNLHSEPADPVNAPVPATRSGWKSGRTKRVVTSVAASAILMGSGAAIGIALTGGAAAATGATPAKATAAGQCAKLVHKLRSEPSVVRSHPALVKRLRARCGNPLLRIAAIGGEHGQVTFPSKAGSKTVAFERGTVESVSGSTFTVRAPDGTTWTWKLIAATKMRQDGQTVAKPKVSSGDTVFVEGLASGGVNQARLIQARQPA